jgi:outer membrane protein assembly factor BamB
LGSSSPIVTGKHLFLTGYEGTKRLVLCFDALTGEILWRREVQSVRSERHTPPNGPATPTPVTDGVNVYVFFPEFGILCYSVEGQERWRVPLGPFDPPHGMATSPVLAGGNVVLAADQVRDSFVAAFDAASGGLVWKVTRPSLVGGYSTPVVYEPPGEPAQVVVSGPLELIAYSVETGEEQWSAPRTGVMPISVPVFGGGLFFVNNGAVPPFEDLAVTFKADRNKDGRLSPEEFPDPAFQGAVLAIDRVYGNGDGTIDQQEWDGALRLMQGMNSLVAIRPGRSVAAEGREGWRLTKGLADIPSPLFYQDSLYMIRDGGVLTRLNPRTGEIVKQIRLRDALDKYFASPVAGDGKVYLTSQAGKISVVRADTDEILAMNDLGEECYATPAIANGGIYLRTAGTLYFFAGR